MDQAPVEDKANCRGEVAVRSGDCGMRNKANSPVRRRKDKGYAADAKQSQLRGMGLHENPDERGRSPHGAKQSQFSCRAGGRYGRANAKQSQLDLVTAGNQANGVQNKAKFGRLRKTGVWAKRGSRAVVPMRGVRWVRYCIWRGHPVEFLVSAFAEMACSRTGTPGHGVKSGYAGN